MKDKDYTADCYLNGGIWCDFYYKSLSANHLFPHRLRYLSCHVVEGDSIDDPIIPTICDNVDRDYLLIQNFVLGQVSVNGFRERIERIMPT